MTRLRRRVVTGVVILTVGCATTAAANPQLQTPPRDSRTGARGTASVAGIVVSDEPGGRPVRRALVTLRAADGFNNWATVTNDDGRFALGGLPPGRATIIASKPGWVTTYYGAKPSWRAPGVAIALVGGEHVPDVTIRMLRGGVIAGRLTDDRGRALVGIAPMVLELRTVGRVKYLVPVSMPGQSYPNASDDRGDFRFYGLPPGRYFVGATATYATAASFQPMTADDLRWATGDQRDITPGSPRILAYAPTYFPGTPAADAATPIDLAPREERTGVDFVVEAVPTATIAGIVSGPDGGSSEHVRVTLTPRSEGTLKSAIGIKPPTATTDGGGNFKFAGIPAGRYILRARGSATPGSPTATQPQNELWAEAALDVAEEHISGVTLALKQGVRLTGTLQFDTTQLPPPKSRSTVSVRLIDARAPITSSDHPERSAPLSQTGTFDLGAVPPGDYFIAVSFPPLTSDRWIVRSIIAQGVDVRDRPFEVRMGASVPPIVITVTDRVGELSGRLLDAAGRPAPEYFVFAFPADRRNWHEHAIQLRPPVRPATDGRYSLSPLPPGDYYLIPLTEFEGFDYVDPSFLEQLLPYALRLTLAEGERKVQDLTLPTGGS